MNNTLKSQDELFLSKVESIIHQSLIRKNKGEKVGQFFVDSLLSTVREFGIASNEGGNNTRFIGFKGSTNKTKDSVVFIMQYKKDNLLITELVFKKVKGNVLVYRANNIGDLELYKHLKKLPSGISPHLFKINN